MTAWRLVPVEQIQVVLVPKGSAWGSTGVRCPECRSAEIVYNGNYFCGDLGNGCSWVLPFIDEGGPPDGYNVDPDCYDLLDALYAGMVIDPEREQPAYLDLLQQTVKKTARKVVQQTLRDIAASTQVPQSVVGEHDVDEPGRWSDTPEGKFHAEMKKLGYIK